MSDLTLDMILCKKKYFPGSHLVEIDQNVLATPIVQTQKETMKSLQKQKFMKEGSWIWIGGLQGAKDLNGKLGEIVKFNKDKQRYEVFIPDIERDAFSKSILDIRKVFRQEDESSLIGMKLIKPENLKPYYGNHNLQGGKLVECQYVSCPATRNNLQQGPPYGPVQSRWYPR